MKLFQDSVSTVAQAGSAAINAVRSVAPRAVEGVEHSVAHHAATAASSSIPAVALSSAMPVTWAQIGGFSLTAAINASFSQHHYNKTRKQILKTYADEFSTKLGKSPDKLGKADLDLIAKGDDLQGLEGNRTVTQAIDKAKRQRNLGIGLAIVATLGTFSLLTAIMASTAIASVFAGAAVAKIAAEAIVGVSIYHAIKDPLHWIGDKIFGVEKKTAHDRIVSMKKDHEMGREITKERILSVFIAVDPELEKQITKQYGRPYDDLSTAAQRSLVKHAESIVPLETIALAINGGKMNPTELAFTADGQMSGFIPEMKQPEKPNLFARIKSKVFGGKKNEPVKPQEMQAPTQAIETAIEESVSRHVERLGYRKPKVDMGHAERIEQSRVETSLLAQR